MDLEQDFIIFDAKFPNTGLDPNPTLEDPYAKL